MSLNILIKSIELENEGNKIICYVKIIDEILYITININNNIYEGNITLNKIRNQIEIFNDDNINEKFEEIMKLNNDNFKLLKEKDGKYKLEIKFIIINIKYLYIDLYNNNNKVKSEILFENNLNKQNKNDRFNNFDINSKELITKINYHTDSVYCFTILKDGRLVSGSFDKSIIIYNKKTYQPDLIIKEHTDAINCLTTLSSGTLASCSWDNKIKLFNIKENKYEVLQTLNDHADCVYKIIELRNKSLVSCSADNSIIFYNKDNNNKYTQDNKLNINGICYSVIETKDNEICYSVNENDTIYFYDVLQKKEISKINNININYYTIRGFIMISKELLLIPGINQISIININKYELLKIVNVPNSNEIIGTCMLNENILLTGDNNNAIKQWKIEGDNIILKSIKYNAHKGAIFSIIKIGNGHIISGSADKSIKIW